MVFRVPLWLYGEYRYIETKRTTRRTITRSFQTFIIIFAGTRKQLTVFYRLVHWTTPSSLIDYPLRYGQNTKNVQNNAIFDHHAVNYTRTTYIYTYACVWAMVKRTSPYRRSMKTKNIFYACLKTLVFYVQRGFLRFSFYRFLSIIVIYGRAFNLHVPPSLLLLLLKYPTVKSRFKLF